MRANDGVEWQRRPGPAAPARAEAAVAVHGGEVLGEPRQLYRAGHGVPQWVGPPDRIGFIDGRIRFIDDRIGVIGAHSGAQPIAICCEM